LLSHMHITPGSMILVVLEPGVLAFPQEPNPSVAAGYGRHTVDRMDKRPTVSVITATSLREERRDYLEELHASLDAQELVRGSTWEWIVALDGLTEQRAPAHLLKDSRVKVVPVRKGGAATARNHALALARATVTCCVDDDDLLPSPSLAVRLEHLERFPGYAWVAGGWENIRSDGSREEWRYPARPGVYAPGDVWRTWTSPMTTTPFGHQALLVRTDALRRVGGWQGLIQAEDLGMLVALTGETTGAVIPEIVYHYRFHEQRTMSTDEHQRNDEFYRIVAWERGRLVAEKYGVSGGFDV